jgi:quercetin dioxygenase-like cupin family protein
MFEAVTYTAPGQHQTFFPQKGVVLHLLHGGPRYQAFIIEVEPDTRYHSTPHEGGELRFVVSGEVVFDVAGEDHAVPAGGMLKHPSKVPHGFRTGSSGATFVTLAFSRGYDIAALFRGADTSAEGAR